MELHKSQVFKEILSFFPLSEVLLFQPLCKHTYTKTLPSYLYFIQFNPLRFAVQHPDDSIMLSVCLLRGGSIQTETITLDEQPPNFLHTLICKFDSSVHFIGGT